MAILVDIDNERYIVDVGYGPDVSPVPLKLVYPARAPAFGPGAAHDDLAQTTSVAEYDGIAPQRFKIEYRALRDHTDPRQRSWVVSAKRTPEGEFYDNYAFNEFECFPQDYGVMNWSSNVGTQSFFVKTVIAQRFLSEQELADEGEWQRWKRGGTAPALTFTRRHERAVRAR